MVSNRRRSLREFGTVAVAATGVGLVLFCFDILISLVAISIAVFYGLAVLFDIRAITSLVARVSSAFLRAVLAVPTALRTAWKAVRREVRKGLED